MMFRLAASVDSRRVDELAKNHSGDRDDRLDPTALEESIVILTAQPDVVAISSFSVSDALLVKPDELIECTNEGVAVLEHSKSRNHQKRIRVDSV